MTKAQRWASDYFDFVNTMEPDLVTKYDLKVDKQSVLAAMFEKFAEETPTHNVCPECESRREETKIKLRIFREGLKAEAASVAQLAQQSTCNAPFGGSIPSAGSKDHVVTSLGKLVYCDYHGAGVHKEDDDCVGRIFEPKVEVCTHEGYDTRAGVCFRCGKTDLPTVARNRRSVSRFIDICRIALGPLGGSNLSAYKYECLCQTTPHAKVCIAWNDKKLAEFMEKQTGESVNGKPAASKAVTEGSSPSSPAKCRCEGPTEAGDPGYDCPNHVVGYEDAKTECYPDPPTAADLGCHSRPENEDLWGV